MSANGGGGGNERPRALRSPPTLSGRSRWVTEVPAILVAFGATILAIAGIWIGVARLLDDSDGQPADDGIAATTTPSSVPTYDIDRDGTADFALIEDQVVAAPADGDGSGEPVWLSFAGTVVAALLAAGAAVGVAWLNRDGGRKLDTLEQRLERLEGPGGT